jgi:hypothetical protein
MMKVERKRQAGWIVVLAVLCGAAVLVPSMISLVISLFEVAVALFS